MKKFALLAAGAAVLTLGAACNREKCPAYSATKAANRVASPITASAAPVAAARQ